MRTINPSLAGVDPVAQDSGAAHGTVGGAGDIGGLDLLRRRLWDWRRAAARWR